MKKHHLVHSEERNHQCYFCGKRFKDTSRLQTHIRSVHEKLKDNECRFCNQTFSLSHNLKRHIEIAHEKIEDIKCDICEESYFDKYTLKKHHSFVHGAKPAKKSECYLCGKTFKQEKSIKDHMKRFHSGIFF